MAKVKDILGPRPPFQIQKFAGDPIDPNNLWVSYDPEADSIVIYLTGGPQPTVSVYTDNNLYLMVDPRDRKLVGFHLENWEKNFVPAHREIQAAWSPIKQTRPNIQPWETLLRMLALWTVFILRSEHSISPALQPA